MIRQEIHYLSHGDFNANILLVRFCDFTFSKLVVAKRNSAIEKANFTVIIRPTDESNYKNTVDVLDEMIVTNQPIYVLTDISPKEVEVYQSKVKL